MIFKRIAELYLQKEIIWSLSKKEIRKKYSGTRIGIWWALILPLLLSISIDFVFNKVFKVSIPNYTLFVLSVIFCWIFFSQALNESLNCFLTNSPLLRQVNFLREIIPVSSILSNFLIFCLGFSVVIPIFVLINPKIILLIPHLLINLMVFLIFTLGLGLYFSSANVFYRDISHFLSMGLIIWFWITPIFYPLESVPFPYKIICLLNPLTYFILNFRNILYYAQPDMEGMILTFILSLIAFFGGYYFFLRKERELLKKL